MSSPASNSPARSIPPSALSEAERERLAQLLFPDYQHLPTLASLESSFPPRDLAPGALVTRVAPSPTGFAHIGLVYVSLLNRKLAHQTKGAFLLRIEDTDQKREVEGAVATIVDALLSYGITPDEGFYRDQNHEIAERGSYGSYKQSLRKNFYRAACIQLVRSGHAYPCFASEEELQEAARLQGLEKVRPGYYGRWAVWRDQPLSRIEDLLAKGTPYVIRFRASGDPNQRVVWKDGVKGGMSLPENDLDAVILKSDGQSLYHLAHMVDDHFMRVTDVIRGDEWISSVPLHLQLYRAFDWSAPAFAHLSTIQKMETLSEVDAESGEQVTRSSKRKLSKRKDPEANVDFYAQSGFPPLAVIEYLLNLANSDFEDWRKAHPHADHSEFEIKIRKTSPSGALTDMVKLTTISRDVLARLTIDELFDRGLAWAKRFDPELAALMGGDPSYAKACLNIERNGLKPSKRIITWADLRPQLFWMYDKGFDNEVEFPFPETISVEDRTAILRSFLSSYSPQDSKDVWFDKCKEVARDLGFASEMKDYKKDPAAFKGHIGDVTMVIRVAISGRRQTPDLHEVMLVLGESRTRARVSRFL